MVWFTRRDKNTRFRSAAIGPRYTSRIETFYDKRGHGEAWQTHAVSDCTMFFNTKQSRYGVSWKKLPWQSEEQICESTASDNKKLLRPEDRCAVCACGMCPCVNQQAIYFRVIFGGWFGWIVCNSCSICVHFKLCCSWRQGPIRLPKGHNMTRRKQNYPKRLKCKLFSTFSVRVQRECRGVSHGAVLASCAV